MVGGSGGVVWRGRGLVLAWICCIVAPFHWFVRAQAVAVAAPGHHRMQLGAFFDRAGAQVGLGDE